MDWAGKLIDGLKLGAKAYFAITVTSALVLFLTENVIRSVGAEPLLNHRAYISAGLVLFGVLWLTSAGTFAARRAAGWWASRKRRAHSFHLLETLGEDEKRVLAYYFVNGVRTQQIPPEDGAAASLRAKGVLFISSPIGNLIDGFQYTIQSWAWDYLAQNQELMFRNRQFPDPPEPSSWARGAGRWSA